MRNIERGKGREREESDVERGGDGEKEGREGKGGRQRER